MQCHSPQTRFTALKSFQETVSGTASRLVPTLQHSFSIEIVSWKATFIKYLNSIQSFHFRARKFLIWNTFYMKRSSSNIVTLTFEIIAIRKSNQIQQFREKIFSDCLLIKIKFKKKIKIELQG